MNAADQTSSGTIEKLGRQHDSSQFASGKYPLDDWLRRFALTNQQNDSARTYVLQIQNRVFGYYSLAAGTVRKEESPPRVSKGLANHPVSVILLARLAVDRTLQGKGIGKLLLRDALYRSLEASEIIAARAVLVHAIDEEAANFYLKFGFQPSPIQPRQLMLLLKDLRATLKQAK
jgi:GNAT superfamily N-acetyltransferase